MSPDAEIFLPKRCAQYGVGKQIGGAVYVHRAYEHRLGPAVEAARAHLTPGFDYTVVKYNQRTGAVSFIHSPDFDTAPEPGVGNVWTIFPDGRARFRRQPSDPELYHHKWLFVAEDYPGFDVAESRRRSLAWLALPGVDRKRIGRRSYWTEHVLPRLDSPAGIPARMTRASPRASHPTPDRRSAGDAPATPGMSLREESRL